MPSSAVNPCSPITHPVTATFKSLTNAWVSGTRVKSKKKSLSGVCWATGKKTSTGKETGEEDSAEGGNGQELGGGGGCFVNLSLGSLEPLRGGTGFLSGPKERAQEFYLSSE